MTYSFNLVDQKWIPCVQFDGRVQEFSLREALTKAHTLRGLQGDSPLETAAHYRLLLAVLHSALRGPRNRSEWADLWAKGYWETELISRYLDKWHDRFDLFHPEKPFYQAKEMVNAREKTVNDVMPDIASANNATLFNHNVDEAITPIPASKAARTLVVLQSMSIAGGWGLAPKESSDAPWGRGVIFLVEGRTMFETLALNLLAYPDEKRNNMASNPTDRPAWENDDPYKPVRQIPEGYLDYLTWQNRRVLLFPEGDKNIPVVSLITMFTGLKQDAGLLDPMKLYRAGKEEGYYSIRFTEDRALWRESASLFALRNQRGYFPPKTFYWLFDLAERNLVPKHQVFRFMALGMANDQAKVEFFQEEHLPLPLNYLENDELVEILAIGLQKAENVRFSLKIASQWFSTWIISPKSYDKKSWKEVDSITRKQAEDMVRYWNVERYYWQQLEIPFLHLLEDLPEHPEAIETWHKTLRSTAKNALEQAANAAGIDATALKAAVRARGMLGYSLKELFPEPEKEVTA